MTNSARFAAVPLSEGGTSIKDWLAHNSFPAVDLADCPGMVIIAPHPDDETLGLGATAAELVASGARVQVVSVSDGGGAYPDATAFDRVRLEKTRRAELAKAMQLLGLPEPVSLGLPDGRLGEHEKKMADMFTEILEGNPGLWCAVTWRGDGHPDHEAAGRAAAVAAGRTGATLVEYPLWMWHWATPGDPDVPWQQAFSVPLSRPALGRKQHAAQCFRSQFDPATPDTPPVLPPFVLRRLLAVGEVLFT